MTLTLPAPRLDSGIICERPRCRRPAVYAEVRYRMGDSEPDGLCRFHAAAVARRTFSRDGDVLDLTDEVIQSISARLAARAERERVLQARRRAESERVHALLVERKHAEYDREWTSTLVLDEGWAERYTVSIRIHPADQPESSRDAFEVAVEMDPDVPATIKVRNANEVTFYAARELVRALSLAAAWIDTINEDTTDV